MWMMRQAGRHMKVYRDLVQKYPTFRERSEIPEVCALSFFFFLPLCVCVGWGCVCVVCERRSVGSVHWA